MGIKTAKLKNAEVYKVIQSKYPNSAWKNIDLGYVLSSGNIGSTIGDDHFS